MTASTPSEKTFEIIVGLDLSELGDRAFAAAVELAGLRSKAELHVIVVGQPRGNSISLPHHDELLTDERARTFICEHVAELVRRYEQTMGLVPIERIAVYVTTGDPASQIVDLARAIDSDLVVVGTRSLRGAERLLLGSVAEAVARSAPCGVYIARPADFIGDKKVPSIEAPLQPGEPHLKPFFHRRTYHYVDRNSVPSQRLLPVS